MQFDIEIEAAIKSLPEANREAVHLFMIEKKSCTEIAMLLQWSVAKTRSHITRGITLLKLKIDPTYFKAMDETIFQTAQRLLRK